MEILNYGLQSELIVDCLIGLETVTNHHRCGETLSLTASLWWSHANDFSLIVMLGLTMTAIGVGKHWLWTMG